MFPNLSSQKTLYDNPVECHDLYYCTFKDVAEDPSIDCESLYVFSQIFNAAGKDLVVLYTDFLVKAADEFKIKKSFIERIDFNYIKFKDLEDLMFLNAETKANSLLKNFFILISIIDDVIQIYYTGRLNFLIYSEVTKTLKLISENNYNDFAERDKSKLSFSQTEIKSGDKCLLTSSRWLNYISRNEIIDCLSKSEISHSVQLFSQIISKRSVKMNRQFAIIAKT